jgi:hypothetical protein
MSRPEVTHVLLDFFGTLVRYSASPAEQNHHATHALVRSLGADDQQRLRRQRVLDGRGGGGRAGPAARRLESLADLPRCLSAWP